MSTRIRAAAAPPSASATGKPHDPGLAALLTPKDSTMLAVEKALLRGEGIHASPPIAEQIAARLAGLIALDLLKPGQRLLEADIGAVLQVSRAPVREALRILERDHLARLSARRGATVTAPDAEELLDIFEVRLALYGILLAQVMRDRPDDLQRVFEQFLPRLEQASRETPGAYAVQSFLLNQRIADLCSNRLVVDQLKALSLRTLRYVRLGFAASPGAVASSLEGWRAFQGAVVQRDIALVQAAAAQRTAAIRSLAVAAVRHA
ncbi:GntR family transcriptional regulator [Ottowia sp.]|uniref:GntR family transcriptional regulator n=1 Tax=Ottowia sp. TaxID=1898956 RepID=UPI0025DDFC38|nr:GntR family transcriptional regulator [Ottowia sp.]MBK6615721.1 GntR family transcriptional regulator [Ottowia sp.]MBK6746784.1 GntR family transcriptional regulator [Ottowia sp.]